MYKRQVDTDENRINDVMNIVTNAQIGDSTNAEFLKSLGVGHFDVCMVTIGDSFQNSLETTSLLKELGARYVAVSYTHLDVYKRQHYSMGNAWKIFLRDRMKHSSPNSAQTESACAGALKVSLSGDNYYFGRISS